MMQMKSTDVGKRCANRGDGFAVRGISYTAENKEFVSLPGPSRCGKSTTLNTIASLESVSEGTVEIDGISVETPEPHKRDPVFAFQDYALYSHLLIYENITFGIRMRRMPKAETVTRVRETAGQLGLVEQLHKRLRALPEGQRQRITLIRIIARRPGMFLYGEPLSNLDTLLRDRTHVELKLLHNEIGATSVYIIHDREETISFLHKIAVMGRGRLEQYGSPEEIYSRPATEFIAGFVKKPRINLFTAESLERGPVAVPGTGPRVDLELSEPREKIRIGLRPSKCHVVSASGEAAAGKVAVIRPPRAYNDVIVDVGDGELFVARGSGFPKARMGDHITIDLRNVVRRVSDIETGLGRGWRPRNPGHRAPRWGADPSVPHPGRMGKSRRFSDGS